MENLEFWSQTDYYFLLFFFSFFFHDLWGGAQVYLLLFCNLKSPLSMTAFILCFSSLINHLKHFTLQVTFTYSQTPLYAVYITVQPSGAVWSSLRHTDWKSRGLNHRTFEHYLQLYCFPSHNMSNNVQELTNASKQAYLVSIHNYYLHCLSF